MGENGVGRAWPARSVGAGRAMDAQTGDDGHLAADAGLSHTGAVRFDIDLTKSLTME